MILKDLYEKVLIKPLAKDANKLYVISGYASATFINKHLTDTDNLDIKLIIGMPGKRSDHLGYMNIINKFKNRFNGFYLDSSPPVHCKLYGWFKNDEPIEGFSGSANYSQPGFSSEKQVNQLNADSPIKIRSFFDELRTRSTNITDYNFDTKNLHPYITTIKGSVIPGGLIWETEKRVRLSFLDTKGRLPQKSGLNWGTPDGSKRRPFREPSNREAYDQAYLPVRKEARNEGFLPKKEDTFTLITDDGKSFDCVVAQDGRKAIESTYDNSELGRYFRNRLGLELGIAVQLSDLEDYGRTDYTIEKIDSETVLLDFSQPNG